MGLIENASQEVTQKTAFGFIGGMFESTAKFFKKQRDEDER